MPNWVTTIIEFRGADKDIASVFQEISNEDTDDRDSQLFDFDKLIPMPASLEIESSSTSTLAYAYYCARKFNFVPSDIAYIGSVEDVINKVDKDINSQSQTTLELGKSLYENKEKYGAVDWYGWCVKNWGTKWNASNVETSDNMLYFATAWSFPEPIVSKLAELCDKYNVSFEGEWADEDMGSNTGGFESFGNELHVEYYENCSHEAYAAYIRCNGDSDCIGTDTEGKYYHYNCSHSCPSYEECQGV